MTCIVGRVEPHACILERTDTHGALYQGSRPRPEWIAAIPGPLVVVNLDCDTTANQWVNGARCFAALELIMDDRPQDTLPDNVLLAHVAAVNAYLDSGFNVLVHCALGVSRSSYLVLAVLMRRHGWGYDEALAYLLTRWDRAQPNKGFAEQLQRLEGEWK